MRRDRPRYIFESLITNRFPAKVLATNPFVRRSGHAVAASTATITGRPGPGAILPSLEKMEMPGRTPEERIRNISAGGRDCGSIVYDVMHSLEAGSTRGRVSAGVSLSVSAGLLQRESEGDLHPATNPLPIMDHVPVMNVCTDREWPDSGPVVVSPAVLTQCC
jgi:hypothetical protein